MPTDLVVGTQWGDEGKGKIVDVLAETADRIVRFQGGNNAGHTIMVGEDTFKLHLLPSGVVRGKPVVIGNGCVVDPEVLLHELDQLADRGMDVDLQVSDHAAVITPLHRLLDGAEEVAKGKAEVGTTRRGIGPTYMDKMARVGLRVGDLVRPERLRGKVETLVALRNRTLASFDVPADQHPDAATIFEALQAQGARLAPFVTDTVGLLQDAHDRGETLLLEGAQGTMLDIDHGSWPFVTSSNTTSGGAVTGTGLPPQAMGRTFGVVKAYTTRVGAGPFPTELPTDEGPGKHLATLGHEFGTTTGRPRRCGWLDLVVVRHAVALSGISHIALTKLDVLNGLDTLQVATSYMVDGSETRRLPSDPEDLAAAEPVYTSFDGWETLPEPAQVDRVEDLPAAAQAYLAFVRQELDVDYAVIGTGPRRAETISFL